MVEDANQLSEHSVRPPARTYAAHIPNRNPEEAEKARNCVIPANMPTIPKVPCHTIRGREFYLSIYLPTSLHTYLSSA